MLPPCEGAGKGVGGVKAGRRALLPLCLQCSDREGYNSLSLPACLPAVYPQTRKGQNQCAEIVLFPLNFIPV